MVKEIIIGLFLAAYVYAKTTPRPIVDEIKHCGDKMSGCAQFDLQTICKGYRQWSETNCRKSCGFCDEVVGCTDKQTDCSGYLWRVNDFCTSHKDFADVNCPATCNVCKEKDTCVDLFPHCQAYNQMYSVCNLESNFRQWAEKNCQVSCGYCTSTGSLPIKQTLAGKMSGQEQLG